MSENAKTSTDEEALRAWASEWADKYDQNHSDDSLRALVGKRVQGRREATAEEGPRGFVGDIVGYSIDTLLFAPEHDDSERLEVHRFSLLTDEGKQVPIFAGMELSEIIEE